MQGWRRSMEDSHIANLDIGDGVSIFGVFDGHGGMKFFIRLNSYLGGEVALFVKNHFIKELKKLESFKKKDYRVSLQEAFLKMDTMMLSKDGKKELMKLAKNSAALSDSNGGVDMNGA